MKSEETTQHTSGGATSSLIENNVYSLADNPYRLAEGFPSKQEPEVYTLAGSSGYGG